MTLETLKLSPPVKDFYWVHVSQMFGVAKNTYQSRFNIPGHNALDIGGRYGADILASHDGIVVNISLDSSRERGMGVVLQTKLDDGHIIQTIYWHLSRTNWVITQFVLILIYK